MKKKLTQNALLQCLERAITEIPDTRNNNRTKFSIRDAIIIVLSVFFLHSGSLNGHLELLGKAQGKRNRRLFGIEKVPSANQIRNILDLIDPNYLCDAQDSMIFQMQRSGVLKQFWAGSEFGYLAAFDGTEFFAQSPYLVQAAAKPSMQMVPLIIITVFFFQDSSILPRISSFL